jgi:arabinogalactan oligomer/maltooligosaccharide transport system permease protein
MILWTMPAWGVDLTLWHATRGGEEEGLLAAIDAWTTSTGHTVTPVALPFAAFDSKIETAVPRGNGPDVFVAAHGNLGKWQPMGLVTATKLDEDAFLSVSLDALRRDDRTWGWPLAVKSLLLLYDPEKVASPPTTTDALFADAARFVGPDRYGLAVQAAEPYFHAPWLHAFGGSVVGVDGTVDLAGPGHVEALAFARRLAVDSGLVPAQPTEELVSRLYAEGRVPYVVSGPWFVAGQTRPIASAPLPAVSETGRPARPFLTVDAAFVTPQSSHPVEASDLAAFLAGPEGSRIRQDIGRQAVAARGVTSDDPLVAALALAATRAVPLPTDPRVQMAWEAQARALRDVLRGALSPERAAAASQATWTALSRPVPPSADPRPWLGAAALAVLGALGFGARHVARRDVRAAIRAHRADYPWLLPAVLASAVLMGLPMVTGSLVSLFEHDRGTWTFVGLRHFADILTSAHGPAWAPMSFWYALVVSVGWTAANLALHVGLGLLLALALHAPWLRLRPLWRAVLVLPWAVPTYITALVWKGMFHAQMGAVNALVEAVGGPSDVDWTGSFATAFTANLITNTWLGFPFMMVVTLGALSSIPRDLLDAASVDGTSAVQRFRHVVWPCIRPTLLPAVVLGSVWTFNQFNVVYLVSGGEPNGATELLVSESYRWAFSRGNRYGYAAAYALLVFAVLWLWSRTTKRLVEAG